MKRTHKNQVIEVMWITADKKTYYTNSLVFNDIGVHLHTNILMNDISLFAKNEMDDCAFTITYDLTKPLSKDVILL